MTLLRFLSPASFWSPDYICQSGWIEHAPFAFWICDVLRPRCFVELGTHYGYSYFAFCQAIDRLALGTAAYAVDTWQGDEHAGFYDENVFQAVAGQNTKKYAAFSRLIRSTFDEAIQNFEDRSIDLLHIDGRHFYRDVKHDFESWRPKLSDNAIVLFHDTSVRERGFGVWQFFEELSETHPAFQFFHCHGLGVLAIGEAPVVLAPLFESSDEDAGQIRAAYAALGSAVSVRMLQGRVAEQNAQLVERDARLAEQGARLAEQGARLAQSEGELALAKKNIRELSAHLRRLDAQIGEYLYHLNRINASPWWRLGMWFSRLISALGSFFAFRRPKHQAAPARAQAPERASLGPESITLPPASANPEVSVVILSYGQVNYTLWCLKSIAENLPLSYFEVIVSDDCSGAADLDKLKEIANLTFLQPPENLGFLKHANWAVAQTKGKYILLLNNDTELTPGAIDALVETARTTPDVGLVGSKLVYPDGRLQEAGGIVWDDASAWNYGRLEDPDKPEFNYVRDADYISGASILVPRTVWDRLGGFDETFTPAYYEDTDLAFRLRQNGLRVLYQPASMVIHYEGASHGTDTNSGIKAHQITNQARMREKWLPTLREGQYRNGEHVMRARDRSKDRRTMLVIDHYVPEPDRDAGSRNMIDVMKSLQLEGWVIKFWPHNLRYDPIYTPKLQQMGVETMYSPWLTSFESWLTAHGDDLDLIFLSRPNIASKYVESIKRIVPGTTIIFYGHDLHSARMRMQSRVINDPALMVEAGAMEIVERRIWRNVDLVLYPSQEEAEEVQRMEAGVDARTLVPFCFDHFRSLRPPPTSSAILFVGGFAHPPNVDGAIWLAEEILPLVRRDVPLAKLWIVGSNPAPPVKNLASEIIDVTGYVTEYELVSKYAEARVAVVPLRFGAGVKLKVVEALWEGLPLVTTSIGAQGLDGLGEVATVVDEAEPLARELVRLLCDDVSWVEQVQRQLDYAQVHFSRQASIEALREATSAAAANAERRRRGATYQPV